MNRPRSQRATRKPSASQSEPRSGRQPVLVRQEVIGCLLLILAALTMLGLSRISSGAVLAEWAAALRRVFGWGAYLVALFTAFCGLRLVWRDLGHRTPLGPRIWVGLELLLLVILTASHARLVLRSGVDEALQAADQGRAGGLVGWALATLLMGGLPAAIGSLVLLVGLAVALGLLLPVTWPDVRDWIYQRSRWLAAAVARWRSARQGASVTPEAQKQPWWAREEPPKEARPRRPVSADRPKAGRPRKEKKASTRPHDGSLPPLDLLNPASPQAYGDTDVRRKTQIIEETLASFGVPARVVDIQQGPTITQFGLDPGFIERRAPDGQMLRQRVRVARIASLADDLALALAAAPLRIEAPVPGRSLVGLEVPNEKVSLVSLRRVMESAEFANINSRLAIGLGEDVAGHPVAVDLGLMPHLLIAGATGSGKSVCINAVICCLLLHNLPEDLRMLMIDPKMVELVNFDGIPHLIAPVVVDVEQVIGALAWVSRQMDERYQLLHQSGARNLAQYNVRVSRLKDGEPLPTLVVLIDELADMMMMAPDEVERHICRLAQMGRATGIHLVIATQRPSVDVVTGLIKANFPARISFAVTSQVDSRVILDQGGAENLLGRGDMLFMAPQMASPIRLQGCFVSDQEIERLIGFWRSQRPAEEQTEAKSPWADTGLNDNDDLLEAALEVARGRARISTSFIQRQLRIGFPRAARLMDQLEEQGLVGPDEGAGRGRAVLMQQGIDLDEINERLPGQEPG